VQKEYAQIGGSSPINMWTEVQRKSLETALNSSENAARFQFLVLTAMRYWNPLIPEVAANVARENCDKIILLPLYPHFSISTTGSSFNEWKRYSGAAQEKTLEIHSYPVNEYYIDAVNRRIDETLLKFPEPARQDVQIVFSAHGTPVSYVKKGDPYSRQIGETIEMVMRRRDHSHGHHLCYQSKVGPARWLEPATDDMIRMLANAGKRNLLIVPISFVSDHVETLFELDIEYRHIAQEAKIENYIVMEGLNDSPYFTRALQSLVENKLQSAI
jgi:ferrochelatase